MTKKYLPHHPSLKLLLVMSCLVILSGCWNSRELDELGIAVSLGIDKNEEGDYILVVQVINPSEIATDAPTTRPPVSSYNVTGKTLFEAFRNLATKSPRKIYVSQLRLVVLGPKIVEEGIMPSLDLLYRNHEFRTSFYVSVAKNASVESILSIITPYEKIPANKIMNSIDNVENHSAATKGVSIDELISSIRSSGKDPVLSGIILEGQEDTGTNISNVENVDAPTNLEIDHLAVFNEDKLVGWLDEDASQGLNYAIGNVKSTVLTSACDKEGTISVEILRSQASMSSQFKDDQPAITIDVQVEGDVGEVNCKVDLSDPFFIDKVNKIVEKGIEEKIRSTINLAQKEYESDIFGFGEVVHRYHPDYWKKIKKDWPSHFSELEVDINITAEIRRKGNSTQPIEKKG